MLNLKQELFDRCSGAIQERIESAENAVKSAKEASQDDTKSSAGDKYETTREMMQQEISRNEAQLYEAGKLKHALSDIPTDKISTSVQNGSIVFTDKGNFFISVSAGQFEVNDQLFYAISSASPIGKLLVGAKAGEIIRFNGKEYKIIEVA